MLAVHTPSWLRPTTEPITKTQLEARSPTAQDALRLGDHIDQRCLQLQVGLKSFLCPEALIKEARSPATWDALCLWDHIDQHCLQLQVELTPFSCPEVLIKEVWSPGAWDTLCLGDQIDQRCLRLQVGLMSFSHPEALIKEAQSPAVRDACDDPGPVISCPWGTIEGIPDQRQHVPTTNPEEGMPEGEDRADADREYEKDAEKTREEPQQLEWRGDTGNQKRDVNQGYSVAEQQSKGDVEGEQSAGDNDKALLLDSAACHVPGGTWRAEVRARIRGSATTLFQRRRKKRGITKIKGEEGVSPSKGKGQLWNMFDFFLKVT
ncbi:hypothetical protein NDU88_003626 [Pleurodeles waltl]|uniref:Uncharacterized protein n=1 Tax=Pleurodeles waltl TaxID=8319 RepID=A0AAV7RIR8_PLEWA|nr:hypothetical protein NDU88_003626 [Pleurodeles waltl]